MNAQKAIQKLLRTPKPTKKSDLLTDREYRELASINFEEYLRFNFSSEQLELLSAAEVAQLECYYKILEKNSDRARKRIYDKRQQKTVSSIVENVTAPPRAPAATEMPRLPIIDNLPDDESGFRHVIDEIEKSINQSLVQHAEIDMLERAVADTNDRIDVLDLSQMMPPKEMLLEEAVMPEMAVSDKTGELDIGPPGDAGPFLGVDDPMPLSDIEVRNQILMEFPSLQRPDVGGRFEDLDEALVTELELIPPPQGTGISFSTPIAGIPTTAVRRLPDRFGRLYNTDLSAIKGPSTTEDAVARAEPETPVQPPQSILNENVDVASITADIPMHSVFISNEPEQASEPVKSQQYDVNSLVPASLSTDSSSVKRPVKRPRKSHKKTPIYGENPVLRSKLRSRFEYEIGCRDLESFESARSLIQWILDFCLDNALLQNRQLPPTDFEERSVIRDISSAQPELSSIREQNQSRLFPIQENLQREELAVQQLQDISLPISITKATDNPHSTPIALPSPKLPEVSLGYTKRVLDTGLGNQTIFPDTSTSLSIPHVVITNTSFDISNRMNCEQQIIDIPEAQKQPSDLSKSIQPIEQNTGNADHAAIDKEVLIIILMLYFSIQRTIVKLGRNSCPIRDLMQSSGINRVTRAKSFMYLLLLKKWGFIDTSLDDMSRIQSISLRRC